MTSTLLLRSLAALLIVCSLPASAIAASQPIDHFVLSLSWSPTFCASAEAADEHLQCGTGRKYAFVVHGLWPQSRKASPEYCESDETWVPEEQIAEMLPIMPSKRLVIHEWRKHGTCSNLSIEDYFDLTRTLFNRIKIPERYLSPGGPVATSPADLVSDFLKANRGLAPDMIGIHCKSRGRTARLSELRICFSPDRRFVQCRPRSHVNCAAEMLLLPPVKGKSDR